MKEQTNKTIVIYKSKYGSTKQYAKWIAQEVKGDLFENSEVDVSDLQDYDNIVLGGSLHAVGIKGVKVLTENFDRLKDKQLIVLSLIHI